MGSRGRKLIPIILLVVFALPLYGSQTGDRLGPVYPIIEPDWLEWLPQKMKQQLDKKPVYSQGQLKEAIQRRMPEVNLPEVRVSRTYMIDPTVQVSRPVTGANGLIPAGSRVNPLEHLADFRPILVIDGRRKGQIAWAKAMAPIRPIVLAVAGDILSLGQLLGMPIYPVPKGLIDRFSIERVPVVISKKGKLIQVEEVVP
jgi:conjugal transfer pilus assembly protein TraW